MNDEPYITFADIKILVNHAPRDVEKIIRSSQFYDRVKQPRALEIGGSTAPESSLPLSTFKQMVEDGLFILKPKEVIVVGAPESWLGNPKKMVDKYDLAAWITSLCADKFTLAEAPPM